MKAAKIFNVCLQPILLKQQVKYFIIFNISIHCFCVSMMPYVPVN